MYNSFPTIEESDRGALIRPKLFSPSMTEYNIEAHLLQDISGDNVWLTLRNDMNQNLANVFLVFHAESLNLVLE